MFYFVMFTTPRRSEEGGVVRALRDASGGYVAAVRTIGSGTVLAGPTEANTSTYMTMKYEEVERIAFGLHLLYTMS